jgi:hypothetical protein
MSTRRPAALATASVLVLSLLAGCGDKEDDPDADASETPSASGTPSEPPSPSDAPTPTPSGSTPPVGDTTKLTIRGLGQGSTPAVDLLAAADPADPPGTWSLVRPSGASLELSVAQPLGFATMGNGLVLLDGDADDAAVSVVDGTGAEVRREVVRGYRIAVTPDRSIVAWLGSKGETTVLEGGGGRTFDLREVEPASEIAAILGEGTCQEAESEINGCTAFLNADDPREAYLTSSHGIADVAGTMLSISDAAPDGRLIGLVSVSDEGSCSGVYAGRRKPEWQTCDHTLTRFSPDAARVLGTDAYLDGFGQRSVAFLDAHGTLLHEFRSTGRGASVLQTAWEDDDHVLAVVYERGRWSIVRLGVDGSAELALGPLVGGDLDRPFILAEE